GLGLLGADLPLDIRDISADFINWEWSWKHAGQTALDLVALLPIIGAVKYADEAWIGLKNGFKVIKNSDIINKIGSPLLDLAKKIGGDIKKAPDLNQYFRGKINNIGEHIDNIGYNIRKVMGFEPELVADGVRIGDIKDTRKLNGNDVSNLNDRQKNYNKIVNGGDGIEGVSKADLEVKPFNEAGKLKPNIKYKAGEYDYLYETDDMGRISKFETDNLQLTNRESRLPHNPDTPGKLEGDHAGHLAGDRFGGSPELDNLVSQASNVNLSQYKKIENVWATAIKQGKQVKVNVEIKYDGDGLRPSKFNIKYTIDGKPFSRNILN
ncbi:DNA/RNA non-specific endonuclease, partial [Clostridium sp.]|uniref:DNA/RNA non-specific endonuclease n=1 Tax=Clostridium sp. TaxID=1506 RepID=UPI00290DDC98